MESTDDIIDEHGKSWTQHRMYTSEQIEVLKVSRSTVEVKLGNGNETVVRDFRFGSSREAARFEEGLAHVKSLEKERTKRQIDKFRQTQGQDETTRDVEVGTDQPQKIDVLVEIVSATDLPVADIVSTDAYVIARMAGKEIHRTDVISKSLNPIWTLETGALFVVRMSPEEFFAASSGMNFIVKDYDAVGANEILGNVSIPLQDMLDGTGDRIGYDIVPDKNSPKAQAGKTPKLFLRFKRAAQSDIEFMAAFADKTKKYGVYANETFLPIGKPDSKFMKRQEKRGPHKEVLVRTVACGFLSHTFV